jgi:pyruvate formate lyase activating enzyme
MSTPGRLVCDFCEHRCSLREGQTGRCGIRRREGDTIRTINYGEHVSLAVDPIEKKPLYHVLPGAQALSSALYGCNFTCTFCQNCSISQPELFRSLSTRYISPRDLAKELKRGGYPVAAFTYSEPTVWQDYMLDAAGEIKNEGGLAVMVTNGFFTEEALDRMLPVIDAFNIDLKGDEDFYRKLCGGHVEPVIRNIQRLAGGGEDRPQGETRRPVLEVTTMLMEGEHTEDGIVELAHTLDRAGVQVWHLSAFYPAYRMSHRAPTTPEFLSAVYERVRRETSIPHVYAFSRQHARYQQTFCSRCGALCIDRRGFGLSENHLINGECPECGTPMYGIF